MAEASAALHPDEIVLALVRRLARAFDLAGCAFVSVGADGAQEGRVVAEVGLPDIRERLDLRHHPEIGRGAADAATGALAGRRAGDPGSIRRRTQRRAAAAPAQRTDPARAGAARAGREPGGGVRPGPRAERYTEPQRAGYLARVGHARPPAARGVRAGAPLLAELQLRAAGDRSHRRRRRTGRHGAPPDPAASRTSSPATANASSPYCCPRPTPTAPGGPSLGCASDSSACPPGRWPPAS